MNIQGPILGNTHDAILILQKFRNITDLSFGISDQERMPHGGYHAGYKPSYMPSDLVFYLLAGIFCQASFLKRVWLNLDLCTIRPCRFLTQLRYYQPESGWIDFKYTFGQLFSLRERPRHKDPPRALYPPGIIPQKWNTMMLPRIDRLVVFKYNGRCEVDEHLLYAIEWAMHGAACWVKELRFETRGWYSMPLPEDIVPESSFCPVLFQNLEILEISMASLYIGGFVEAGVVSASSLKGLRLILRDDVFRPSETDAMRSAWYLEVFDILRSLHRIMTK